MRTVNCYLIQSAMLYLMTAEAENGRPLNLNPDDEPSIKQAFEMHILPEVQRWSAQRRERLRLSLAYFLDKPEVLEYDVLANVQDLTMPEPSDYSQFFRWLYESLFPDQPINELDLSGIEEDNDVMQINFEPGELTKE